MHLSRFPTFLLIVAAAILYHSPTAGQASSFTYQGQLRQSGTPFTGVADLEFRLYDALINGSQIGPVQSLTGVPVEDGLFQVALDFGAAAFNGSDRFLEIRVNGAPLNPRQKVTATPYALLATGLASGSVGGGSVDPSQVQLRADGTCSVNQQIREINEDGSFLCDIPGLSNTAGALSSAVGGGISNSASGSNSVIGGGESNLASGRESTIGGGLANEATEEWSAIGGGERNRATARSSTVSGGERNDATGNASSIGGGDGNEASGQDSTIAGGISNVASGSSSAIGGGGNNQATGGRSTVGGGGFNAAIGFESTVSGGSGNTTLGPQSTVSGGLGNCAGGAYSWAGGLRAKVRKASNAGNDSGACFNIADAGDNNGDEGTFVWADSQNADFVSSGPDQFLVRAQGGIGFGLNPTDHFEIQTPFDQVAGDGTGTQGVFRIRLNGATRLRLLGNGGLAVGSSFNSSGVPGNGLRVAGIFRLGTLGAAGSTALCQNASGEIATCSSSARYKSDIDALDLGLETVLAMKPVGYRWTTDDMEDIGFIAEEVADIDERLITRNQDGIVEGVRYDRISAILTNAVRELHQQDTEDKAAIHALTLENQQLRARLTAIETEQALKLEALRAELALLRDLIQFPRGAASLVDEALSTRQVNLQ